MDNAAQAPEHAGVIDRHRLALALALTPVLAPFYSAILFERPWDIPYGLIATYTGALLFGLPGAWWLLRRRRKGIGAFAILGALSSLPGMLLYAQFPGTTHLQPFGLDNAAVILAWGTVSGIAFWLIGIAGDAPLTLRSLFDVGPPERLE
jgi:peptidoglycan/LPS O-acetylase OafA/YrhL